MNSNQQGIPDNLRQRFPQLQPLNGVPSLWTVNGFGVGMYGKRDFDRETETYVKTRCLCALFLPLFALAAYRVADAGSRTWFFFGREPLSQFARSWNIAMGCVVVLLGLSGGWSIYTASPEYRARQDLKQAAQLLRDGEPIRAAGAYQRLLSGPVATDARFGFKQAVEACLESEKPRVVTAGLRALSSAPAHIHKPAPLVPDVFQRGLARVAKFRESDPDGALDVLVAAAAFDPKNREIKPLKVELLKAVIAARPDNVNRVVELAQLFESDEQLAESVKVLLPCQGKLGSTEGARILGQHLLAEGKNDEAYELLFPYVQARLEKLRTLESSYTNTISTVSKRALSDLRQGRGEPAFYSEYDRATKARKQEMVDDYIQKRLEKDPAYLRALADLKQANQIVHVALDLGIVQLNRAQNLINAAARKAELEAAEKTFLAVRGFAGETDEYRMFLGQVCYWLGKSAEGRQLFDELLAKHQRAPKLLISLAQTLRLVGEHTDARALAEEAYTVAKGKQDKFNAAALRALIFKDTDDQIAWLEKSDTEDNWVQTELNGARGKRALHKGDKAQAALYLRNAINAYEKQPKTAASLNNCGLVYFDLYEATGDLKLSQRGMALMDEAIKLAPGDSILLNNTMYFLVSRAVADVVRDAIHPELLGEQTGIELLGHLYQNEQERTPVYQALRENESMKKGLAYLDKALLLAPKSLNLYGVAMALHGGFRDLAELEELQQRFRVAAPDFHEVRAAMLAAYSGEKDQEHLAQLQPQIKNYEEALRSPAVRDQPLTQEHATVALIGLYLQTEAYGGKVDSAKLHELAQTALQKHRSSASHHTLLSVCALRAAEDLAKQNPEFAALRAKTRRSLSSDYLLAFALTRGGVPAEFVRENANLQRMIALVEESVQNFPSSASIREWALLRSTAPQTAATLAARYRDNKIVRLLDDLEFELNPVSATAVLEQYWSRLLSGDEKGAVEVYQQAIRDGVPLAAL